MYKGKVIGSSITGLERWLGRKSTLYINREADPLCSYKYWLGVSAYL